MPRRDATPQENGMLILGYIEDEVRREMNPDGEECPGCGGAGEIYDCIDGCCVDPESGCAECARPCYECKMEERAFVKRVRVEVLQMLDVDVAVAYLKRYKKHYVPTSREKLVYSLHEARTACEDLTAEERADSACWVEGLI